VRDVSHLKRYTTRHEKHKSFRCAIVGYCVEYVEHARGNIQNVQILRFPTRPTCSTFCKNRSKRKLVLVLVPYFTFDPFVSWKQTQFNLQLSTIFSSPIDFAWSSLYYWSWASSRISRANARWQWCCGTHQWEKGRHCNGLLIPRFPGNHLHGKKKGFGPKLHALDRE
jgi:hypothetical protein